MQNTLALIFQERILKNAALVKARAGTDLYAVVKDDAYGHGAEKIALLLEPTVRGFAVATVLEGEALRISGIRKEILVLSPCLSEEEALAAERYGLTPTVTSLASFKLLLRAGEKFGFSPRAQLKINTGMNRYGIRPECADSLCRLAKSGGVEFTGVFSHFYAPEEERARERQYELFSAASERVIKFFPSAVRHLSATGGILAGAKYNFDAVRCGIALYGYLPKGFEGALPVKPAMKVYAAVSHSGMFTGGGVGYRPAQQRYRQLSTLRLGYGDGFLRAEGLGEGDLCMDAFVKRGSAPFGKRRLVMKDASVLARKYHTIVYEVLVNVGKKAEKRYV